MRALRAYFVRLLVLILILYVAANIYRIVSRKYYVWLPDYIGQAFAADETVTGPRHVLFFFTDHFEPDEHLWRTRRWAEEFPRLSDRHRDATGRRLQHTWFYHVEREGDAHLAILEQLVRGGYGEVEMHLHHGNNTDAQTRELLRRGVAFLQRHGFARTQDGKTRFAFIHGNFSLDNSQTRGSCGADREISLLTEAGAFVDMTFPALWHTAQPKLVNRIYETWEDGGPKSYDRDVSFTMTGISNNRLVIFPGPLTIRWAPADVTRGFYRVDDALIHPATRTDAKRVDSWIKTNIHVPGRPEWVFVKVWAHGASTVEDMNEVLAGTYEDGLRHLEAHYNDGKRYILHYVTAREAYNVAKAAFDGKSGDPTAYYDYEVGPYVTHAARGERGFSLGRDVPPPLRTAAGF
jgi:hypothetical protein